MPTDILKSLKAIGASYGVSEKTALKLVHAGEIPAKRVGKSWILSLAARAQHLGGNAAGGVRDAA